jgi:hypothetical protein
VDVSWLALVLLSKLGCGERCQLVSLERVTARPGVEDIAVRTRRSGHCGTVGEWTLFDGAWRPLFSVEEEVDRVCSGVDQHTRARVSVESGVIHAGPRAWRWDGARFTTTR